MRRFNKKNSRINDPTRDITKLAGAAIVLGVLVVLGWLTMDIQGKQVTKEIDALDREHTKLSKEREREEKRWASKKTRENLAVTLKEHGLLMNFPNPQTQVVYTDQTGRIMPGQASVAHITKALDKNDPKASSH